MSDENKYLFKIFGRKVNKEEKGYTDVDYDGIARPVLKIPADIPKGRRRLTAVYTDERKEINAPSLDRAWLIYGSKCYVHCPNIYIPDTAKEVTLIGNLFANNRPVPGGNAEFKISSKLVSGKIWVSDGHVEHTENTTINDITFYQCHYLGKISNDEREGSTWISEDEGEGVIYPYHEDKTPIVVDVMKIITNQKDTCAKGKTKLVARVYHKEHESEYIKYVQDVPSGGTVDFFVGDDKIGTSSIDKTGFASVPFNPSKYEVGVYTIVAVYNPSSKIATSYSQRAGSNTLFIGNDENKPCFTQNGLNCGIKGDDYVFSFNSSRKLNGKLRIYIDGMTINASECEEAGKITFMGTTQPLYEQVVEDVNSFTFTTKIPNHNTNKVADSWGYSGNHNMVIQYLEKDEELGDMEYWYYWDNFYIQIEIDIHTDNLFLDNTSDGTTYTGNNMYLFDSNGTPIHFKPTLNQIPKSICVGSPLRIYVQDIDSGDKITKGRVRATVTTRKKEKWVN